MVIYTGLTYYDLGGYKMSKIKTIVASLMLVATLVGGVSVTAKAWEKYVSVSGGKWRYGLTGSGEYHMGYSYYHHNSRAHGSSASLAGRLSQSYKTAPGYTSCANTESLCSTDVKTYYKFY